MSIFMLVYWSPDKGGKRTYEFTPVRPSVLPELFQKNRTLDFSEILHEVINPVCQGNSIFRFLKKTLVASPGGQKGSKWPKTGKNWNFCHNFFSTLQIFLRLSKNMNKVNIHIMLVSYTLGKFVFVNPRGSKGSKLPKTAKNETFWSITFVPYIKFF